MTDTDRPTPREFFIVTSEDSSQSFPLSPGMSEAVLGHIATRNYIERHGLGKRFEPQSNPPATTVYEKNQ